MADITHNLVIHSPKEKVYNAVATQEGVRNWWTVQTDIISEIGGSAEFRFGEKYYIRMEIIELIPDEKVSWVCRVGDTQWVGTEFHYYISEENGDTLLRFGHINWADQTEFFGHCNFQWGRYLMSLKKYCETGKGEPFEPDGDNA